MYSKPTANTTNNKSSESIRKDLNGEGLDVAAERSAFLAWSEPQENIIITGNSDFNILSTLRGSVLKLKD